MRIFISVDMEGLAGTFSWKQENSPGKGEVRKNMTEQMSFIIEGIQQSDTNCKIKEILIADSHGNGDTLLYDFCSIDDRIHLVSGSPRPDFMMTGLTSKYSTVFLVGYHSGKGALKASMDHTYSSSSITSLSINGKIMNEATLNAAFAGSIDVPVSLITGDLALSKELKKFKVLQKAEFVVTKEAVSRFAVKNRPVSKVKQDTVNAVKKVLKDPSFYTPYKLKSPFTLRIELVNTAMADYASLMPGIKRINGHTVEFRHKDYRTVFNAISAIALLAVFGK